MKKIILVVAFLFSIFMDAQETKPMSLISVSGEGKIKITPDQVAISVAVESKGIKAADVKSENDTKIDAVLKFIKKMGVDAKDFQTQMVSLNDQYDYQKKKHNYVANQTINILLKDLTKYDLLMEGLIDSGINNVNGTTFKSSKFESYKSEARKLAMNDAKQKADDYVSVLAGQKVGRAFTINDNAQTYQPQINYVMSRAMTMSDDEAPRNETLAVGEIEVICNVSVSFVLE
ncbi:MAG: hypothetical protein RLZZ312_1317 [Bacteroidota bacterium]|jgi:uncharacterized protein YggE